MDAPVSAKFAILQALVRGESFGLELIDRVRTMSGGALNLHQGSLYPALRGLERAGFVSSADGPPLPERAGRPRRYYRLTAAGRRAATEQRATVASMLSVAVSHAK